MQSANGFAVVVVEQYSTVADFIPDVNFINVNGVVENGLYNVISFPFIFSCDYPIFFNKYLSGFFIFFAV